MAHTTKPQPATEKPTPPRQGMAAPDLLGGENVRGEVAGCPTGLPLQGQVEAVQQPGGGGAPGTGASTAVPISPGEGITEEEQQRAQEER